MSIARKLAHTVRHYARVVDAVVRPRVRRAYGVLADWRNDLISIDHVPARFGRRAGDFTANVCGHLSRAVRHARYRINDGPWREVRHRDPRVRWPRFCVELAAGDLRDGSNRLDLSAVHVSGRTQAYPLRFDYDPKPPELPLVCDWRDTGLDVQDGRWERVREGDRWCVHPAANAVDYDRIITVAGAFSGGRDTSVDVIFRRSTRAWFGFGVLPMWGGRPDSGGASPRDGWNFSLAWFYSKYSGVGIEWSFRDGGEPPAWVSAYRNFELETGVPYRVRTQTWAEQDARGAHLRFVQQMKWWRRDTREPGAWLEISDAAGAPLPAGEYGVALVAHCCDVEFGPVTVRPRPGPPGE